MRCTSRLLALSTLAVAAAIAVAPAAYAGKNGGGSGTSGGKGGKPSAGSGTISLVLVDSTDGLAHYGQTITFNVSTTSTDQPWVHLQCYQNKSLVAEGWDGYFDGSLSGRDFTLASPSWTGGAADCTGTLTNPQWQPLASTSFHVYA